MKGSLKVEEVDGVEVSSHNGETGSHHCHGAEAPAPSKLELSLHNDALEKERESRFQLQPKLAIKCRE